MGGKEGFLDLEALVFAVVSRAFSAMPVSDYEPRALPWAGMKDAFGVGTTSPRQEWEGWEEWEGWRSQLIV